MKIYIVWIIRGVYKNGSKIDIYQIIDNKLYYRWKITTKFPTGPSKIFNYLSQKWCIDKDVLEKINKDSIEEYIDIRFH